MPMVRIAAKDRVATIQILSLDDKEAIRWLQKNLDFVASPSDSRAAIHKVATYAFSRRNSPRLRRAVGQYGSHIPTLRRMLREGTSSERLAVLSNPLVGPRETDRLFRRETVVLTHEEAIEILRRYKQRGREFSVFLSNPYIGRDWLTETLIHWDEIDGLDAGGLLLLVGCLTNNQIISKQRDDVLLDGFSEYRFWELNRALANLIEKAPVTQAWAYHLGLLLENLYLPAVPDYDFDKLFERWKDPQPKEDGERLGFVFIRTQITQYLVVRDHRQEVRKRYTVEHSDPAIRLGLYCSLRPNELFKGACGRGDFCYPMVKLWDSADLRDDQRQVVDICKMCFDADKNDFIDGLIRNGHFWRRKEEREFLANLAWDLAEDPYGHMDMPNTYREQEAYYRKHHPEFFEDEKAVELCLDDSSSAGKVGSLVDELEEFREELGEFRQELRQFRETFGSQAIESVLHEQYDYFRAKVDGLRSEMLRLIDAFNRAQRNGERMR